MTAPGEQCLPGIRRSNISLGGMQQVSDCSKACAMGGRVRNLVVARQPKPVCLNSQQLMPKPACEFLESLMCASEDVVMHIGIKTVDCYQSSGTCSQLQNAMHCINTARKKGNSTLTLCCNFFTCDHRHPVQQR